MVDMLVMDILRVVGEFEVDEEVEVLFKYDILEFEVVDQRGLVVFDQEIMVDLQLLYIEFMGDIVEQFIMVDMLVDQILVVVGEIFQFMGVVDLQEQFIVISFDVEVIFLNEVLSDYDQVV